MKILMVGDTHAEIAHLNWYVNKFTQMGQEPDAVLQVGDFGFWTQGGWPKYLRGQQRFLKPTYVVPGNHEDPDLVERVKGPFGSQVANFKLLDYGEIAMLTKGSESVTIMGCGGARCVDDPLIFYPFDPENFVRAREAWEARGRPAIDILMTHEAPYDVGMKGDPRIAALFGLPPDQIMGEPALRDLWQAVRPRLQVNGHHHRLNRHEEDGLRHLTLPTSQRGCALLDTATWQDEFFSTGT